MLPVIGRANIAKENHKRGVKGAISVRDFSISLLWLRIAKRYFCCGDSVIRQARGARRAARGRCARVRRFAAEARQKAKDGAATVAIAL